MSDGSLFGESLSLEEIMVQAYKEELLAEAPVRGLAASEPGREVLADRLARKDVGRLLRSLARKSLKFTVKG